MFISKMLRDLKYDKKIQDSIRALYGKTYKINFVDSITEEVVLLRCRKMTLKRKKSLSKKKFKL